MRSHVERRMGKSHTQHGMLSVCVCVDYSTTRSPMQSVYTPQIAPKVGLQLVRHISIDLALLVNSSHSKVGLRTQRQGKYY